MDSIDTLLALEDDLVDRLRTQWTALMALAVWGDIKSDKLGTVSKLRKRLLDAGERLRSVAADKSWIPKPRERLKNALASCLNLRDSWILVEKMAGDLTGGRDLQKFLEQLAALDQLIRENLQSRENAWATALQDLNKDGLTAED